MVNTRLKQASLDSNPIKSASESESYSSFMVAVRLVTILTEFQISKKIRFTIGIKLTHHNKIETILT
jgi:hypothetical protein